MPDPLLPVLAPPMSLVLLPTTGLHPSLPLVYALSLCSLDSAYSSLFEEQLVVIKGRLDME